MSESDQAHGFIPGKLPAVVVSYDKSSRECRVHIPGLTEDAEMGLLAQIEYAIGDKSRAGEFSTDIEIFPGDLVWVEFECGDARYPIITGYRNPQVGNGTDWRRWHQANIEMLARMVINLIAGGVITIKSDVLVKIDAPLTHVLHDLTVDGLITGLGGMAISGGAGASFNGRLAANGDTFTHNGVNVGSGHKHKENDGGGDTDTPH